MKRALNVSRVLIFLGVMAIALAASAAAVDYFITAINADGTVSCREAAGETFNFRVPDAKAFAMLKVGQKLSIDRGSGKASMQDMHFIILQNVASPSLRTATPLAGPGGGPHQVMINGMLLSSNAKVINGRVFVPLQDFSAALGGGVSLEPSLKLEFPRLLAVPGADGTGKVFPKVETSYKIAPATQKIAPAEGKVAPADYKVASAAQKVAPAGEKQAPAAIKFDNAGYLKMGDGSVRGLRLLSVNRGGLISSQLQKVGGQVYVPLDEILIALGKNVGQIDPNAMSLNFTMPANQGSVLSLKQ